jgi:hypothetical protein
MSNASPFGRRELVSLSARRLNGGFQLVSFLFLLTG